MHNSKKYIKTIPIEKFFLKMENIKEILITDLMESSPENIQPIPIPYDLSQSIDVQIQQLYESIRYATRRKHRILSLVYAYHLGELLENISNHQQQIQASRQLSKYYRNACRRLYYIFYPYGINQIWRTKRITLKLIYRLSFEDYQMIIL